MSEKQGIPELSSGHHDKSPTQDIPDEKSPTKERGTKVLLTSDLSLTNQSQASLQVHATQVDGRLLWWMYAICERECSVYILKISTSARYYKDATKQGRDLEL